MKKKVNLGFLDVMTGNALAVTEKTTMNELSACDRSCNCYVCNVCMPT